MHTMGRLPSIIHLRAVLELISSFWQAGFLIDRYEEAELSKTSALFDLTQERNKIHPRGVDHEIHQGVLSELNMTRTRLKQQVNFDYELPSLLLPDFTSSSSSYDNLLQFKDEEQESLNL